VFCSISLLSVYMCAYTLKFKVHCGSTFEPGASALPSAHHLCVLIDGCVGKNKKNGFDGCVGKNKKNGNLGDFEKQSNMTKLKVCDKEFQKQV